MKTRIITAFFFTIVMLGSVFSGSYVFAGFYLILSLATLLEFYKLIKTAGIRPHVTIGVMVAAIIFLITIAYHFFQFQTKYLMIGVPLVFAVFVVELYKKSKIPFANIAYTFVGFIYVTIPFCFFYALGYLVEVNEYKFQLPLSFLLMLWANDTGSYLFGMRFGKRRLFERHSPKKSWEGFLGGMFSCLLVAFIVSLFYVQILPLVWAGMAGLISAFGTLGDLIESMLKRSLDTKDSGHFLPGHGGFLDRFDGLLIAAPVVYVYLYLAF